MINKKALVLALSTGLIATSSFFHSPVVIANEHTGKTPIYNGSCVAPEGYRVIQKNWNEVWGEGKEYPDTTFSSTIGARYASLTGEQDDINHNAKGTIITVPFTAKNDSEDLDWSDSQPSLDKDLFNKDNFIPMSVSISECPGNIDTQCKVTAETDDLEYGLKATGDCRVTPNKQYFMNWHFAPSMIKSDDVTNDDLREDTDDKPLIH